MELALNNFEVLDQTQMQEIDGDGAWADGFTIASGACAIGASVAAKVGAANVAFGLGLASGVCAMASGVCNYFGW